MTRTNVAVGMLGVAVAVAACGGESGATTCTHAGYVADYLDGAAVTDCGELPVVGNDTPAARATHNAAHDCVIAAYGANTSFEVTWNPAGIDSSSTESYVGVYASGTWTLAHITSGTGKDGKFQGVFRSPCASFTDDGACSRLYDSLCITCGGSPVADSCKP